MKKVNVLFLGVLVFFAGFLGSCTKDDTNDGAISLAGDTGYTAGDATVTAGGTFTVKWTATSTTDMKYVSITKDGDIIAAWNNIEIASSSSNTYINTATLTVPTTVGTYTFAIVIYDKSKVELARKSIVITVSAAAGQISTYASINLGGSSSNYGSYLDAETGSAYTLDQINASATVKSSIDIIFDAGKLYNTSTAITSSTGTKFATSTITTAQFDASTDDALFSALTASLDNITVSAGTVVFFKTAGGKKGLIKVISLTSASGTLTIAEKIQN
jgi:hypothetical protein